MMRLTDKHAAGLILLLDALAISLVAYRHKWPQDLKTAYNKAVKLLKKKE
jgi:hypothetical protein